MSAGCMRRVVVTALRFMREFHDRAPLNKRKFADFWRLDA